MSAAYRGNLDCLDLLIVTGANVNNAQNEVRRGPAAKWHEGFGEVQEG